VTTFDTETQVDTETETTTGHGVFLSAAAAAKVAELIAAEGDETLFLRLGVRPGGCSGFSYEMFFDTRIESTDIVNETDGVRVAVDIDSAPLVAGATVDFKDMGLQGSGFAIENPNQQRSCGCGQSFC
jgi:iron-sulfur cluster assembly accessory protein